MTYRFNLTLALVALLAAPLFAFAQSSGQFSPNGIFGCNAGQYGGSPGTTAAIGGVYVPVFDAAVTLNTGILVYKECILRGIVDAMRKSMTASEIKSGTISFNTGRITTDDSGNTIQQPDFPTNLTQDKIVETDRVVALNINNDAMFSTLNPAFKDTVKRAAVRGYYLATRQPYNDLACPYTDVVNAINGSPDSIWAALDAFKNPACTPLGAYLLTDQHLQNAADAALSDMLLKLSWGGGIYDIAAPDANGNMITKTPARFIAASEEQLLASGFKQQEAANDIDQMVGSLFAGMTAQVIQDNQQGLAGLTQGIGGQPSYLDRVIAEAQNGLKQTLTNAALAILTASQAVEQAYGDTMRAIAALLTGAQDNFKNAESACWTNIIQRACSTPLKSDNTCKSTAGFDIKVSTSTIYSQAAMSNSTIFSLLPTVQKNIDTSVKAMALFAQLIASVTNDSSPAAQKQALDQLDQLIRQNLLHVQKDLDQANASQKSVQQTISTLAEQVAHAWNGDASDGTAGVIPFDGTYPPQSANDIVGWCNYGSTTAGADTIQKWIAKWKK